MSTTVQEMIEVDLPIRVVYNQWTQFADFPEFMDGVEKVQQLDDTHLHWIAKIAGVRREWDAEIMEQVPDERISWRSLDGPDNAGAVTFQQVGPTSTRVVLQMKFDPYGVVENVGDKLGIVESKVRSDLERFREFISARQVETGGWRGEVHGGDVTD